MFIVLTVNKPQDILVLFTSFSEEICVDIAREKGGFQRCQFRSMGMHYI